eukprot:SAG22_NODE_11919_length_463_cov_1.274725_1_plen_91_part_01
MHGRARAWPPPPGRRRARGAAAYMAARPVTFKRLDPGAGLGLLARPMLLQLLLLAAGDHAAAAPALVAGCADPADCTHDLQSAILRAHWPA